MQSVSSREGDKLKDKVGNPLPIRLGLQGAIGRRVVRFVSQYRCNILKLSILK